MPFTVHTTSTFEGTINGVLFTHQQLFNTVEHLLEHMVSHFTDELGININELQFEDDFIKDLKSTVEYMVQCYDDLSLSQIESEFRSYIDEADSVNDIQFSVFNATWRIEDLNQKLASGVYTFVK